MKSGIEAINVYAGVTCLDSRRLFEARGLDLKRFDNLMMEKKSVGLPCEDVVTHGVNAAKPIVDRLSEEEKKQIELVIACTETSSDYAKAMSTYMHDYLGLSRNCRIFEVKHACYAGTASLQMANYFAASEASLLAKALIIAADGFTTGEKGNMEYAEPAEGTGAVAILVSGKPKIMEIDFGAAGYYSLEIRDSCRPRRELLLGDTDLSLFSYLDCLENSYKAYADKIEGVDFQKTFDYFAFHTPFGGMVRGAHRNMMRKFVPDASPKQIEADFQRRVMPSLRYGVQVGNLLSGSLYLALCGLIDNVELDGFKRVGLFSYGSGCSSEFYSGNISPRSKAVLAEMEIGAKLKSRYELNMEEYEKLIGLNLEWGVGGIKDKEMDISAFSKIYEQCLEGRGRLVTKRVKNYYWEYGWS